MKTLLSFCFFAFLTIFSLTIQAQDFEEDPLKHPEIWAKLLKTPSDFTLWNEYIGREWGEMSKEEKTEVIAWRRHLLAGKTFTKKETQITGIPEEHIEETEVITQEVIKVEQLNVREIKALEAIMLEEEQEMTQLTGNISSNFIMIEDLYDEIFKELGHTYIFYDEKHPKGKYSKTSWVEEQEKNVKKIKKKRYRSLRSRIKITN
jgi:hypothetical protein